MIISSTLRTPVDSEGKEPVLSHTEVNPSSVLLVCAAGQLRRQKMAALALLPTKLRLVSLRLRPGTLPSLRTTADVPEQIQGVGVGSTGYCS